MAQVRVCNEIITKHGLKGYKAYVGCISETVLSINWVKRNIDFKGASAVEWDSDKGGVYDRLY